MEYDFVVNPGAELEQIRLAVKGAKVVEIDEKGRLVASLAQGRVVQALPVIYQETSKGRNHVSGRYVLRSDQQVGFEVDSYDRSLPLVLDPVVLIYSSYLGGSARDEGTAIAVDGSENAYVTGLASSQDFPIAGGGNATVGVRGVFISKFAADGQSLVYSTYIGGSEGGRSEAIDVDSDGCAYITGVASSVFPTTAGALDTHNTGGEVFVLKLNPDGTQIVYSTFLGGTSSETGWGIKVDENGNAYVAGDTSSDDFPTQGFQGTFGGNVDAFVTKLNPTGSGIVYSTYLGGSGAGAALRDTAVDIALDSDGNAYVTGRTGSADFPLTAGVFQTEIVVSDAYIAKLSADGQTLIYSTLIGGNNQDKPSGIAVDHLGNAYITGNLDQNATFPTKNPIQGTQARSFVAKMNATGTDLVYSTYIGGSEIDRATSIEVDGEGNAIVAGEGNSDDFPLVDPIPGIVPNNSNMAFVIKINAAGTAFVYSLLVGGSGGDEPGVTPGGDNLAIDRFGSAYVTGNTDSTDFPTASFQDTYGGGQHDAFAFKISEDFHSYFAQVANGAGVGSEGVINNPSIGNWLAGSLQFTDDNASPADFNLTTSGGQDVVVSGDTVDFTLPPLGSLTLTSDGQGPVIVGAGKLRTNGVAGGVIRFTLTGIGTTGVGASQTFAGFIAPARKTATGINTGIAIVSVGDTPVDLALELRDQDGNIIATTSIDGLVACGHVAQFVDELFGGLPAEFQGSIVVRATGGLISATALELGDDPGEFTTLPVTALN